MKIDKNKLYRLYVERVAHIAETCEWKTFLTADEIVNIVTDVIEENSNLIDRSDECPNCGRILQCYDLCGYEPCNCNKDDLEDR